MKQNAQQMNHPLTHLSTELMGLSTHLETLMQRLSHLNHEQNATVNAYLGDIHRAHQKFNAIIEHAQQMQAALEAQRTTDNTPITLH